MRLLYHILDCVVCCAAGVLHLVGIHGAGVLAVGDDERLQHWSVCDDGALIH